MVRPMRRTGFTLLELSIVLAVLAIVTTLAITAMESTIDQARFDVTQRTLEDIDAAILGSQTGSARNDSQSVACFIADVGRPVLTVGSDSASGLQLAELWSNPRNLRPYSKAMTSDSNIVLFSGWRGPYVKLPTTFGAMPRLLDGFGRSFHALAMDDVTPLGSDQPVMRVRSDGASSPPFNAPLFTGRSFKNWMGAISGSLVDSTPATGNGPAAALATEVRLFVPTAANTNGVIELVRVFDASGNDTSASGGPPLSGYQFLFPDAVHYPAEANLSLALGPKALKISQPGKSPIVLHFWLSSGGYTLTERLDLQ